MFVPASAISHAHELNQNRSVAVSAYGQQQLPMTVFSNRTLCKELRGQPFRVQLPCCKLKEPVKSNEHNSTMHNEQYQAVQSLGGVNPITEIVLKRAPVL